MMDYPETSGNLRKPAAEVSGRFSTFLIVHFFSNFFSIKVRIFWEGHKIRKNLPLKIWRYSVTSNSKWKIFSNFVAFSEYPNFNRKIRKPPWPVSRGFRVIQNWRTTLCVLLFRWPKITILIIPKGWQVPLNLEIDAWQVPLYSGRFLVLLL